MSDPSQPSGAVTLLFTDIEGSTRRWEQFPEEMARALARHDSLMRSTIEEHRGIVFKTIGDAFCAVFHSASDALDAAIAAQRTLAREPWGTVGQVRVRMALHSGPVQHRDNDYFGPNVNRVARLLSAGYGGQVLVSHATAQMLGERLPAGAALQSLGSHRLKDLLQPERLYQAVVPDLEHDFPPIKTLDRQPHNLPAQPTPLIGRDTEVDRIRALLERDGAKLVTLTGPGGTGKTRLALQAAADLVDRFEDGAWFVPLAPVVDPNLVVAAIAQPLGVRETGHEPIEATLTDYLRDKRLLLVLDNLEHVLPAVPAIGRLLASCRNLTVLATSRAALRVYGERELFVPPLPLPDPKRLPPLAALAELPSIELFTERARAVRPAFELTPENATAVAGICVRLDGLPLAIELAAARVRILPPDRLLERLTSRLAILTGGASDRDPRQQTLRGAIAWSHDLLPPAQQTLFRRLGVFVGGGDLEAVEVVVDPAGDLDALDALEALVTQSLVRQEEGPGGDARFTMLETIREFALERLVESGEADELRGRHADRFLDLAETAEPRLTTADQAAWLDRLEVDHGNLRAALTWLAETGRPEEELRLAGALWRFWDAHGHLSEGRARLEHALQDSTAGNPSLRAKALDGLGVITTVQGDLSHAADLHARALELARAAGDEAGMARATGYLGSVACYQGDFDRALPFLHQALRHYRAAGDGRGTAIILQALSEVALIRGDYETASELGAESLALHRARGEPADIARLVHHVGRLSYHREDYSAAAQLFDESLARWRAVGNPIEEVTALTMLARSYEGQGRLDEATRLLEDAVQASREIGAKGGIAFALYAMGHVAQQQGNAKRAMELYGESLALYQQASELVGAGEALQGIAETLCALGSHTEGVILLGAAEALRNATGAPLTPASLTLHEDAKARARQGLGDKTFAEIFAMGSIMSVDQAVAEAASILASLPTAL